MQHEAELNDLWRFDGTNWAWISGSNRKLQVGVYGTLRTPDVANIPGGRQVYSFFLLL